MARGDAPTPPTSRDRGCLLPGPWEPGPSDPREDRGRQGWGLRVTEHPVWARGGLGGQGWAPLVNRASTAGWGSGGHLLKASRGQNTTSMGHDPPLRCTSVALV